MKTSNPVLARLGQAAERERSAGYAQPGPYGQPGFPSIPVTRPATRLRRPPWRR